MRPSTMSDENQHWVPKFLIKNFADSDGQVFCLDIHTDWVTNPSVAVRRTPVTLGFAPVEVAP
jgi:hypothetical protein